MLILKNFIFHRNCSDQTNSDQFPIPKKEKEKENLHASRSQVASHHSESATAIILWIRKISKHRNELHRRWTNHSNRRKSPHLAPRLERKILGCTMLSDPWKKQSNPKWKERRILVEEPRLHIPWEYGSWISSPVSIRGIERVQRIKRYIGGRGTRHKLATAIPDDCTSDGQRLITIQARVIHKIGRSLPM